VFCVALLTVLGVAVAFLRPLQATPHLAHNVLPAYQTMFGWMLAAHRRLVRVAALIVAAVAVLQGPAALARLAGLASFLSWRNLESG
jgi:hypothetical protein